MYNPIKDGIEKSVRSVIYSEVMPPPHLRAMVHCLWELKTETPLPHGFHYHVVPDACVNLLFNQIDTKIAAITALQTTPKTLNLGKEFHYVGIQLLPGTWLGGFDELMDDLVDKSYQGKLQLVEVNREMISMDFLTKQKILSKFVEKLIDDNLVGMNLVTAKILLNFINIHSVADMASITNMSTRQLQRTLKRETGFSPHDFLKVLRVQESFKNNYMDYYADQSHFIHSFRKITGHTPINYLKKFDV